ncbi:hypothetical protein Q765_06650 [Flavobacterium rivuli WB 3.3-2 = DSM 21788]|uniref:Uncharacterized protein n=1 Tax=Flavobacterium rivuli WB 3.3-2 = DSM 21788 TaxID=1121895 RepID=A0A0A2MG99_9FLAO|nr:hypothetical protein Q765_06650 [Flavobacterium rivuli WB 3.3-2 = DSM 21788]
MRGFFILAGLYICNSNKYKHNDYGVRALIKLIRTYRTSAELQDKLELGVYDYEQGIQEDG